MRLHPYLYYFYSELPSYQGSIVIERLKPAGLEAPVDVWYLPGGSPMKL